MELLVRALFMLCVLAAGCHEALDGTLRIHWLTESGDRVEYPKPNVAAIIGPDPMFHVEASASTDMMGGWQIVTDEGNQALLSTGPLFVQLGPYYDVTAQRTIDLDYYAFGRPDNNATSPTPVTFELDGLDPWASSDLLEVYSIDAGAALFPLERFSTVQPDAGATSASLMVDWGARAQGQVEEGDRVYLTQLVERAAEGLTYRTVGKAVTSSTVSIEDGSTTTVTATLEDVPATTSFPVELHADEFAPLAAQVHPSAQYQTTAFAVAPKPGGPALPMPLYQSLPNVLFMTSESSVFGTAMLGNPYPPTWSLVGVAQARYAVSYTAPLASSSASLYAILEVDHLGTDPGAFRPEIGPVQHPEIDHEDAFRDRTGVGLTPLVSWDPPKLGAAAGGYQLTIWQIANDAGATKFVWTAQLLTSGRSVRIPPNILTLGNAYTFAITALAAPHDIEQQPLQRSVPNALSDVLTGMLTP
jgi:hypothetical protein